ncbi:MAG: fibronectin type III domain-containing protein [Chitinophagales bacterium]|nr:fibronectin type III domain-containing protein [Chitinophagales bacterium]
MRKLIASALILTSSLCHAQTGSTTAFTKKKVVSCAAPSNVTFSSVSGTGATVNWTAASPAPGYGYNVDIFKTSDNSLVTGFVGVSATSQAVTGLTAGTQYRADVVSRCSDDGESFYYSSVASNTFTTTSDTVTVKIDFRASGTSSGLSGGTWNTFAGQPRAAVVTLTNLKDTNNVSTNWNLTTIDTANWRDFSGCCGSANNNVDGTINGSVIVGASTASYESIMFTHGTTQPARYDAAKPQFRLYNLPSGTYEITLTGSQGQFGFDARNMEYRVVGATSPAALQLDGGAPGVTNTTLPASHKVVFTVEPNATTNDIFIWMNSASSGANGSSEIALICMAKIRKW